MSDLVERLGLGPEIDRLRACGMNDDAIADHLVCDAQTVMAHPMKISQVVQSINALERRTEAVLDALEATYPGVKTAFLTKAVELQRKGPGCGSQE